MTGLGISFVGYNSQNVTAKKIEEAASQRTNRLERGGSGPRSILNQAGIE